MKLTTLSATIIAMFFVACSNVQTQTNSGPQVITQPPSTPAAEATPSHVKPGVSDAYSVNSITTDEPVIAITFDDGPHATLTPKLLDLLKERDIKATFFVVGQNAEQYPQILQRIDAEGHELANHSYNHPALPKLSPDAVANQMNKTSAAITAATGKKPVLMRPPYGAINAPLKKRMNEEFGMKVVIWSVDPLDWKRPGPEAITQRIVSQTQPGGIILVHDIHPGTIQAMPATLDQLKAKGYRFVTVSELLAMDKGRNHTPAAAASTEPAATTGKKAPTAQDLIQAPAPDNSPIPVR